MHFCNVSSWVKLQACEERCAFLSCSVLASSSTRAAEPVRRQGGVQTLPYPTLLHGATIKSDGQQQDMNQTMCLNLLHAIHAASLRYWQNTGF